MNHGSANKLLFFWASVTDSWCSLLGANLLQHCNSMRQKPSQHKQTSTKGRSFPYLTVRSLLADRGRTSNQCFAMSSLPKPTTKVARVCLDVRAPQLNLCATSRGNKPHPALDRLQDQTHKVKPFNDLEPFPTRDTFRHESLKTATQTWSRLAASECLFRG